MIFPCHQADAHPGANRGRSLGWDDVHAGRKTMTFVINHASMGQALRAELLGNSLRLLHA